MVFEKENRIYEVDSTGMVTYLSEVTKKEIEKGDFIEYGVTYIDAFYSDYIYTTTNGWRIVDYTKNEDGTYSNVKIISTGIPAKLHYYYGDTKYNTWYVNDEEKLEEFKEILGEENYTFYEGNDTYYALYAAAGLYYNFSDIKFAYSTASRGYSLGYFTSITSNGTEYSSENNSDVEVTGGDLFNLYETKAIVRLLTLREINESLGRTDINKQSTISTTEDSIGLYRLNYLYTVEGMETYTYTTGYFWLASPNPSLNYNAHLCLINWAGDMYSYYGTNYGVRPVICFSSDMFLIDTNGDGVAELFSC